MAKTKRQPAAPLDKLHKHFSSSTNWGERWHRSLYPALLRSTRYTTLCNSHAASQGFEQVMQSVKCLEQIHLPIDNGLRCYIWKASENDGVSSTKPFPEPLRSDNSLNTHWNLDLASLLAVSILDVRSGDKVLDICAAPGGKSIALAQTVFAESATAGCLHSNEFNSERMKRLDDNLRQYIPATFKQSKASLCLHMDGTSPNSVFPLGIGGYDKVLLDAPCSSERHIVHAQDRASRAAPYRTAEELSRWSPLLAKRLAETQLKLLQNAFRSVRLGGRVLYATCSISREENDDVVEAALRWSTQQHQKNAISWVCHAEVLPADLQAKLQTWAEPTKTGWIVLPDHDTPYGPGWGPLFFAVLTKVKPSAG